MLLGPDKATLHKLVCQARYRRGFTYLDRCGRTVNRIMAERPTWILKGNNPSPQNAPLVNVETGTQFNFGSLNYDLSLECPKEAGLTEEDVDTFADEADFLAAIVQDELGLSEFARIGFRAWFLVATRSKESSEQWIRENTGITIPQSWPKGFGGREIAAQGHSIVLQTPDRSFRVAVNGVERTLALDLGDSILNVRPSALPKGQHEALVKKEKSKKRLMANPTHAVMIDIDAYLEEPEPVFDLGAFVRESWDRIKDALPKCFDASPRREQ